MRARRVSGGDPTMPAGKERLRRFSSNRQRRRWDRKTTMRGIKPNTFFPFYGEKVFFSVFGFEPTPRRYRKGILPRSVPALHSSADPRAVCIRQIGHRGAGFLSPFAEPESPADALWDRGTRMSPPRRPDFFLVFPERGAKNTG